MSGYIEDQTLMLDPSEKGVVTIGDLYNCNESSSVGYNLFGPLKEEHIAAYPIQDAHYDLCHVHNFRDLTEVLKISVEFEIPVIPGFLTIEGGVEFERKDGGTLGTDTLVAVCHKDNFAVRTLKEIHNNISSTIRDKVISGNIRATHVVTEVITGARLKAEITIDEQGPNKRFYLKGKAKGTANLYVASASIGASLWIDDTSVGLDSTTDITVVSTPPVKTQPKNMKELLQMIHNFNADDEKPFKMITDLNVTGVPVKFRAVPINQFLNQNSQSLTIPMQKFYKIIDKDLLESLLLMFTTLKDIQVFEYIKTRVLERDYRLENILKDSENQLTMNISEKENQLKILSVQFQARAYRCMVDYKLGLKDTTALRELLKDFEEQFDFCQVHAEVLNYAAEGRQQLMGVKAFDFIEEENDISFFTNLQDVQDWLESSTTLKIVLQTRAFPSSETSHESYGAILSLFELSKALKEIGIETGILYPNISTEFSIQFTSNGTTLNSGKKFMGSEVAYALHILRVAIGKGYPVESRFYSVNAALNSINLPLNMDNLSDIPSLITTTMNFQMVKVYESFLQMREIIAKDAKWKFVLSVDVPDTLVEGMTCFKRLKTFLEQHLPKIDYDLVVGTFGSHIIQQQFSEAPTLLIFHNNILKAVCLDNLDLQMLLQKFLTTRKNEEPDLSSFSLKNLTEICLHPERCRFSVAVAELWGDRESSLKTFSRGSLTLNVDPLIPLTIELIRAAVSGDNHQIMASGAKICLTYSTNAIFPDLLNIFKKHKWDEAKEAFLVDIATRSSDNWQGLYSDLNNYYYTNDAFLSKLDLAIRTLEEYTAENKDTYDSIQNIIDDPECPLDLHVELEMVLADNYDDTSRQKILIEKMTPYIEKLKADVHYTDVHGKETEDYVAKYNTILMKLEDSVTEMKRRLNSAKANPQQIIDDILASDENDPYELKKQIAPYEGNVEKYFEVYVKGALKVFEACRSKITSQRRFQHLKALIDFSNQLSGEEAITTPSFLADIITRYILALNDILYPGTWPKSVSFVKRKSFFQALEILRKSIAHPALKAAFETLDTLHGLPDEDLLIQVIKNLGDYKLNENNYRHLWDDPKFLHLMEHGLRFPNFLNSIKQFQCQSDYDINFVPDFIPPNFAQEIKALVVADSIKFEWKREWKDLMDFLQVLQIILIRGRLPKDFQRVLWNNMENNKALKEKLLEAQVLYFWDDDREYFDEPWDFSAVGRAAAAIKVWIQKDKDNSAIVTEIDIPIRDEDFEEEEDYSENSDVIELDSKWHKLTGGSLKRLDNSALFQFIDTLYQPKVSSEKEEMETFMSQVIPYVLQQLQFLDSSALTPKNISECVEKLRDQFETERPGNINLDSDDEDEENPPISRLDVLTCMLNSMETNIGLWLLQTLTRFPSALPLIIPNITYNPTKNFKLLLPWLRQLNSTVKNSSALFTDLHRFIVCVRIGDIGNSLGKSQLLNSILKPDYLFSSRNEPGHTTGKPLSLPGFVEFVELSADTCDAEIWNALSAENLAGHPILLANVHGDIMAYPETLKLLSRMASCFLVFHMPANWTKVKQTTNQFKSLIEYPKSKNTFHVCVNPIGEVFNKLKSSDYINVESLTEDGNKSEILDKLKNLLLSCMSIGPVSSNDELDNEKSYSSIEVVEKLESSLSRNIIDSCISSSCKIVKDALQLSERAPLAINDFNRIWQDNSDLREYISLFVSITKLPVSRRRIAFMHLSQRLSHLALGETQVLRKIEEALIPHLENELEADSQNYNKENVTNLQRYIKEIHYRQQQDRLITVQNFFNELIAIYELPFHSTSNEETISAWPQSFAEFFDDGNPIELSCHKNAKWMESFLTYFKNQHKDLKIFVVSIIGPENSGKSRLLNDLFGTKFMTRPRERTDGISVSLIHLQESSKSQLQNDIDALLVIDTEGLFPLEVIGNYEAETEQRQMVGQVISLSQLVIFNVTGKKRGTVDFIQNILELPLITLSRIGGGGFLESAIPLDITVMEKEVLLIHHCDENDTTTLESNVEKLSLVFEAAAGYSNSNDLEVGRNHMLDNIFKTIIGKDVDPETIAVRMRPLQIDRHFEDVNEIKQKVVSIIKKAANSPNIVDWFHSFQLIQDWFTSQHYTNSNFPCNLNSIQDLKNFGKLRTGIMVEFKSAVDDALEYHRRIMEEEIIPIPANGSKGDELDYLIEKAEYVLGSCNLENKAENDDKESTVKFPCSLCKSAMLLSSNVEIQSKVVPAPSGIEESVKFYIQRKCDYLRQYICQKVAAAKLKFGIPWELKPIVAEKMKLMMSDPDEFGDKPVVLKECWYYLEQLVVTEGVQLISLLRMILADTEEEYKHSYHLATPSLWKSKLFSSKDVSGEILDNSEKPTFSLDWEKDQWLHNQLQGILSLVFKESDDANIFRVGMIRKLKEKIDDSLDQFQIRHKTQLSSEDKWKVHSRGLTLFYQDALNSSKFGINTWNDSPENNPLSCLRHFSELNIYKELEQLFEAIGHGRYPLQN